MTVWADTKQLLILKYLTAHLETISGIDVQQRDSQGEPVVDGNGAPVLTQKSLLGRVYRGRTIFGAEEHDPFLSILEGRRPDDTVEETVGYDETVSSDGWPLLIQGFMEDDEANPLDNLYRLKGAVELTLAQIIKVEPNTGQPKYPAVYLMGGLIESMKIGPGLVHPINAVQGGTEAFYLPITVKFAMDVSDPHTVT